MGATPLPWSFQRILPYRLGTSEKRYGVNSVKFISDRISHCPIPCEKPTDKGPTGSHAMI
jgi:hypothetical protein